MTRAVVAELGQHLKNELFGVLGRHASVMALELSPAETRAAIGAALVAFAYDAMGTSISLVPTAGRDEAWDRLATLLATSLAETKGKAIQTLDAIDAVVRAARA